MNPITPFSDRLGRGKFSWSESSWTIGGYDCRRYSGTSTRPESWLKSWPLLPAAVFKRMATYPGRLAGAQCLAQSVDYPRPARNRLLFCMEPRFLFSVLSVLICPFPLTRCLSIRFETASVNPSCGHYDFFFLSEARGPRPALWKHPVRAPRRAWKHRLGPGGDRWKYIGGPVGPPISAVGVAWIRLL